MNNNLETVSLPPHLPGKMIFDADTPKTFDTRKTGLPANWRQLDNSTKASLIHSSYLNPHDNESLVRRKHYIDSHNKSLQEKNHVSTERPYITSVSNEVITFSSRSDEDINFRRPRTDTIQRIEWSTMEKDLVAWDKAVKLLAANTELDDESFRLQVVPEISSLLLTESPLFQHLASGEIEVSETHRALKRTPFLHSFDVLMAADTDDLPNQRERFFLRFHALFHDIGKSIIANNDHFQDHGAFSQSMLMEYAVRKWKMTTVEAYQITQIERWHHTSENVKKNYISNQEVISAIYSTFDIMVPALPTFTPDELYQVLMKLNLADTESVKQYRFMLEATEVSLEGVHYLALILKDLPHALQQWLIALAEDGIRYIAQLDLPDQDKVEKLNKVETTVNQLANEIKNLNPEIRKKLLSLFGGTKAVSGESQLKLVPTVAATSKQSALAA